MTKWLVSAAAIVIVAIPVASAASPNGNTGKPATAQAQSANENAAKVCKAERKSLGVEAFGTKYGTNHNRRNAFGKCVSGKSKAKAKKDKDEKEDDDKDENSSTAAKACKAERASTGVDAFAKKYGTNHNLRNAFGKCVSGKSKDKDD